MKNALTMVALLATASLISACSGSGGGSKSESPSTPAAPAADPASDAAKAAVEPGTLIGSFRGTDALCSDGTVSESTKSYLVDTVYTFHENGTFRSETTRDGKIVAAIDGKYKVEGEVLTMTSGNSTASGSYKIVGNELLLNFGKTNDGACPEGQDLLEKFDRINTEGGVVPAPIPGQPDSEVSEKPQTPSKPPRGPSKAPKPQ